MHLVYDFSLGAGSSYTVRYPILFDTKTYLDIFPDEYTHFNVFIDSVSIEEIDGLSLRKQHISVENEIWIRSVSYTHLTLPTTPYV